MICKVKQETSIMEEKGVVFLLLKVSEQPLIAHKLVWILTRKFEIYNYLNVLNDCLDEGTIERINKPSKEMGSYLITDFGLSTLNKMLDVGLFDKISKRSEDNLVHWLKG